MNSRAHRHGWVACLALAGACISQACAATDVLVGPDGDRLRGTLIDESNGLITFQSELLGRLEIPSTKARVERGDESGRAVGSAAPRSVESTAAVRPATWSADLGAKLSLDRGSLKSREDKIDAGLKFMRRSPDGEYNFALDYLYKRSDRQLKNDDVSASLAYDRFLSERRFAAARVSARSELAGEHTNRTDALSLAYGWRVFDASDRSLRVGPSLGYLALTRGDSHTAGAAAGIYARGRGPAIGRTTYEYELQLLDSFSDGRYAMLDARWRKPLGEHFYLALVWRYTWTDVEIESGFTSEWRWDIGWRFGPANRR